MPKPSPADKPDPMAGVVDRLLAQLPGLQGEAHPVRGAPRHSNSAASNIHTHTVPMSMEDLLGPRARLFLALALGTMMAWWPYPRNCGLPLAGYLAAVSAVVIGGGWTAVSAWRYRAALTHVLGLILMFYGLMLAGAELLPRTGYAVDSAAWSCGDSPTAQNWTASGRQSVRTST